MSGLSIWTLGASKHSIQIKPIVSVCFKSVLYVSHTVRYVTGFPQVLVWGDVPPITVKNTTTSGWVAKQLKLVYTHMELQTSFFHRYDWFSSFMTWALFTSQQGWHVSLAKPCFPQENNTTFPLAFRLLQKISSVSDTSVWFSHVSS